MQEIPFNPKLHSNRILGQPSVLAKLITPFACLSRLDILEPSLVVEGEYFPLICLPPAPTARREQLTTREGPTMDTE